MVRDTRLKSPLFTLKTIGQLQLMFGGARVCSLDPCESSNAGENCDEYERWQDRFSGQDYAFGKEPNLLFKILVHRWNYPEAEFDVVVEIFTEFSSPNERRAKWTGMRQTLKPGGLLILQGYMPKQIEYATGGPKQIENLYSRKMLEEAFSDFDDLRIVEEECEIHEGKITCRECLLW